MSGRRQRVLDALSHRKPSRVPVDFDGTTASGMHCSIVRELREHFGLAKGPVKVYEPFQMLGKIDADLREALDVDTVPARATATMFGDPVHDDDSEWKEWRTPWKQDVLIPRAMEVQEIPDGGYVVFPQGDRTVPPAGRMPGAGFYFDAIERQGDIDEDNLDPEDNLMDFGPVSDENLRRSADIAKAARATGCAVVGVLPGTGLASASAITGMPVKRPRGIRAVVEWYMILMTNPEYVEEVFDRQSQIALLNLEKLAKAVGDNYDVAFVCGTDFGTQKNTMFSVDVFDKLYFPYYKRMNDWIHANTKWKTFKHSCGAVEPFIESLIGCGFDILNPVQISAAGMSPAHLKKTYGDRIVFWGGGVDTQRVLPFGTPDEVRGQVVENCRIFGEDGGFVFNAVHNVQSGTPLANILALYDGLDEYNSAGR